MGLTVYNKTQQLSEGVWVFERGHKEWTDEMNRNMEIINELCGLIKNHKTLTIEDESGNTLGVFDNSVNKKNLFPLVMTKEINSFSFINITLLLNQSYFFSQKLCIFRISVF